eukprot:247364-Amphidinium_carterae.1
MSADYIMTSRIYGEDLTKGVREPRTTPEKHEMGADDETGATVYIFERNGTNMTPVLGVLLYQRPHATSLTLQRVRKG